VKLLIDWYDDAPARTRKFLRREHISKDHEPNLYLHAVMTEGKIWKDYVLRRLTLEEYEQELRKRPL